MSVTIPALLTVAVALAVIKGAATVITGGVVELYPDPPPPESIFMSVTTPPLTVALAVAVIKGAATVITGGVEYPAPALSVVIVNDPGTAPDAVFIVAFITAVVVTGTTCP